ncbi:uncharacterized protein LOC112085994 [Eutrema salsugineum]|uniref:uncharacterized protein LOC112085994 n=1 Tax=Eutrema salsugineum TaxID=72664 RepID=UPI000CED23D0|nr:uncharacterized protein LOC112085994 [Eutrema salsugineum]
MEQVRLDHDVHIGYKQAWKIKEFAQDLIRGTPEDSYQNLSKWLFKVTEKNHGSKGILLGASAQNGDYSLYPLVFGIVDFENEHAWTWFFRGRKTVIPDASNLVFVSDRAHAIANARSVVYPLAHHGICRIHLLRNTIPKYGRTGLLPLVEAAADAYTCHEFIGIFNDIKSISPILAAYLEESDFAKWARCYAHFEQEKAWKHKKLVTPRVVKMMLERYNAAMKLDIFQVDQYEFEVNDETRKYIVHLENKQCTYLIFEIDRIPCVHTIAAAKCTNKDENKYMDQAYLTKTWAKAYAESIHPCGDLTNCNFPDTVQVYSCAPPTCKQTSGRPPTKRKRSVGEFGVPGSKSQGHKCSRCNVGGHNRSTWISY